MMTLLVIWSLAAFAWLFHAASADDWHKFRHPTEGMPFEKGDPIDPA